MVVSVFTDQILDDRSSDEASKKGAKAKGGRDVGVWTTYGVGVIQDDFRPALRRINDGQQPQRMPCTEKREPERCFAVLSEPDRMGWVAGL